MLLRELLTEVYRDKKGKMTYHANKFVEKHGLNLDNEYSTKESLYEVVILLSNAEKRATASKYIKNKFVEKVEEVGLKLKDLRTKTYKQVAKMCHPDSETGDTESFQVLQEIKQFFWTYLGKNREKVEFKNWEKERLVAEGWVYNFSLKVYQKGGEIYKCKTC